MGSRLGVSMFVTLLVSALAVVGAGLVAPAGAATPDFPTPQPLEEPRQLQQLPQVDDDVDEYLRFPQPHPPGRITELAVADRQVCALTHDGLVFCWTFDAEPQVRMLTVPLVAITAGEDHFCGIDTTATAICWGDDAAAAGIPRVPLSDIAAGHHHSCAVDTAGATYCWGHPLDPAHRSPPEGPYRQIEAGGPNSCATGPWEISRCWGETTFPTEPFEHPVRQLTVSSSAVCGIDGANRPLCETDATAPAVDPPVEIAADIAAGQRFVCALDPTGMIACDGPAAPRFSEQPPISSRIEASERVLCAVTAFESVQCWDEQGEIFDY